MWTYDLDRVAMVFACDNCKVRKDLCSNNNLNAAQKVSIEKHVHLRFYGMIIMYLLFLASC